MPSRAERAGLADGAGAAGHVDEAGVDVDLRAWRPPRWASPVTLLIAVLGIAVASYLTYAHYTDASNLACSDKGVINCAKVTTSAQSRFLGMPVAVLGLTFFVVMAVACLPWAWRRQERIVRLGRLAAAGGGLVMVLWLVYAELFIIDAICLWCTVVHGLTLLFFIAVAAATVSGMSGVPSYDEYDEFDEFDDQDEDVEAQDAEHLS
jgi:uncharacterized membrane protein